MNGRLARQCGHTRVGEPTTSPHRWHNLCPFPSFPSGLDAPAVPPPAVVVAVGVCWPVGDAADENSNTLVPGLPSRSWYRCCWLSSSSRLAPTFVTKVLLRVGRCCLSFELLGQLRPAVKRRFVSPNPTAANTCWRHHQSISFSSLFSFLLASPILVSIRAIVYYH